MEQERERESTGEYNARQISRHLMFPSPLIKGRNPMRTDKKGLPFDPVTEKHGRKVRSRFPAAQIVPKEHI